MAPQALTSVQQHLQNLKQTPKRLGFFSRLLDRTSAAERYRLVAEQIVHAEQLGLETAWVAQHHFHEDEGGLPAPLVFLAHVGAQTRRIRLGTGIITLPLENAVRVAEDTAVLDLLLGGRLEVGVGTGGTPESFSTFGLQSDDRAQIFAQNLGIVRAGWRGEALAAGNRIYPSVPSLDRRVWQATFSVSGGARAGLAGDGLLLSRTQPRPEDARDASLADLQLPIIEAYLQALPQGVAPRIMASRSLLVGDDHAQAIGWADAGLRRAAKRVAELARLGPDATVQQLIRAHDTHVGDADHVIASLQADAVLQYATDWVFQAHSVDPEHVHVLRSIELLATQVGPALGWRSGAALQAQPADLQPVTGKQNAPLSVLA